MNKFKFPITMISRDPELIDKSIREIMKKLDLDNQVNNAYEVYEIFKQYFGANFTKNTKVQTSDDMENYDPKIDYTLDHFLVEATFQRNV